MQRILQQINESWLQDNNIEMYSKHNERKSVVAGRFIENFKESLSMSKIADIMIIALKVMIKTLNLKLAIV